MDTELAQQRKIQIAKKRTKLCDRFFQKELINQTPLILFKEYQEREAMKEAKKAKEEEELMKK